jgi:cephalosporin-C deacetylase
LPAFEMSLAELREYRGSSPLPADFNAYWDRALAELDALPAADTYQLEPADFTAPGLNCQHLWFTGVGGARLHCKLVRPATDTGDNAVANDVAAAGETGAETRGMPGVALFHGYTHHSGDWFDLLPHAYAGKVVLSLDVRGQGGLSTDPANAAGPTLFGHIVRGVADPDPDKLFYRSVYLDAVQATRILMSLPGVDSDRIGTSGNSQGGALALVTAALNPRIARCAPIHPFLADFRRMVELDFDQGAYEGFRLFFRKYDPLHEHEDEFFERLGYIDVQNFATQVKAEVLWQTGLMDTLCAPSTQFAVYNKLQCPKQMLLSRDYGHEKILYASDRIFSFFNDL